MFYPNFSKVKILFVKKIKSLTVEDMNFIISKIKNRREK